MPQMMQSQPPLRQQQMQGAFFDPFEQYSTGIDSAKDWASRQVMQQPNPHARAQGIAQILGLAPKSGPANSYEGQLWDFQQGEMAAGRPMGNEEALAGFNRQYDHEQIGRQQTQATNRRARNARRGQGIVGFLNMLRGRG